MRLEAEIVGADDFTRLGGRVLDLSELGARLEVEERVVLGERVFVSFTLPNYGVIDAEAVATNVSFDRVTGVRTVGVEFLEVDELAREALRGRLSKLPPILPPPASGTRFRAIDAGDLAIALEA